MCLAFYLAFCVQHRFFSSFLLHLKYKRRVSKCRKKTPTNTLSNNTLQFFPSSSLSFDNRFFTNSSFFLCSITLCRVFRAIFVRFIRFLLTHFYIVVMCIVSHGCCELSRWTNHLYKDISICWWCSEAYTRIQENQFKYTRKHFSTRMCHSSCIHREYVKQKLKRTCKLVMLVLLPLCGAVVVLE